MTTPQTNTRRLAGLTGLALVAVIGVGSLAGSNSARDDLTSKAYKALVEQGLSSVKVDFDGREATLSNGTGEELAKAEKIVEGVKGVRWANIGTGGGSLPDPPTLSITRTADGVNLSGVVPNAEVAARLKDAARATFGNVTGNLNVDRKVGTADWLATMPKLIPGVGEVDNLTLSVDGDSLAIGGSFSTQSSIDTLTRLIEPALGDLSLDNTLKVDDTVASSSSSTAGDSKNRRVDFIVKEN